MPGFRNRPAAGRVCHKIELPSLTQRRRQGSPRQGHAPLRPRPPAQPVMDEKAMRVQLERLVAEHVASLPTHSGGASPVELELLQRRLTKVTDALMGREREVELLRRALAADPGLASVYEEVQGITPDAEGVGQRTEMMKQIFEANLKLKESLTLNRPSAE